MCSNLELRHTNPKIVAVSLFHQQQTLRNKEKQHQVHVDNEYALNT